MLNHRLPIATLVFSVLLLVLGACSSAEDASKAISRSVIESGGIVPAEQLRVAEYLGYYKQNFPPPIDSTLGLDLRLGNIQIPASGGEAYLQIGIAARAAEAEDIAPLNLAIVIDRSGSMDTAEKMPFVKESLRIFLRSLATNDFVSLVAFSDDSEVLVSSRKVGNGDWIENAVQKLRPGGRTNLHAGMISGFKEVERNFDIRRNNRVILLTDGIANQGVQNAARIASEARSYNDKGIYLSTIGLGRDFNDALLSELARQGKGGYHFIDSAQEMDKVFRSEVSGLIQKSASDVFLVIRPGPSVSIQSVTGYENQPPAGSFQIRMQDMGTGDTQVSLVRFNIGSGPRGPRQIATVELRYNDVFSTRDESTAMAVFADASQLGYYDPLWDTEVLRNVTIQRTAEAIREIDRLYSGNRYQEAWDLAYRSEQELRTVARINYEEQLIQDANLMRKYQDTIAQWVQYQTGTAPQSSDIAGFERPTRGRDSSSTERIPVIEPR